MSYRVAMDIGGTFTDFVVYDSTNGGAVSSGKVLTTPANPADGVLEGLQQFVTEPAGLEFLVHGTTVGLNAFLERKGTRPLLVMTAGLRDAYSIARHDRKELYALRYHKPERLVPRRDVVEVVERLRWDGSVEMPLDRASVGRARRAAAQRRGRSRRDLPAPLVREPRARARAARAAPGRAARALDHALARDRARVARVRARLDGGAERLHRAAGRALPRHARARARRAAASRARST